MNGLMSYIVECDEYTGNRCAIIARIRVRGSLAGAKKLADVLRHIFFRLLASCLAVADFRNGVELDSPCHSAAQPTCSAPQGKRILGGDGMNDEAESVQRVIDTSQRNGHTCPQIS